MNFFQDVPLSLKPRFEKRRLSSPSELARSRTSWTVSVTSGSYYSQINLHAWWLSIRMRARRCRGRRSLRVLTPGARFRWHHVGILYVVTSNQVVCSPPSVSCWLNQKKKPKKITLLHSNPANKSDWRGKKGVDGWQRLSVPPEKILTCRSLVRVAKTTDNCISMAPLCCKSSLQWAHKPVRLYCLPTRFISAEVSNLFAEGIRNFSWLNKLGSAGQERVKEGRTKKKKKEGGRGESGLCGSGNGFSYSLYSSLTDAYQYVSRRRHRACHIQYRLDILHNYYFQESLGSHRRERKWQAFKMVFKSCGITRAFQK